MPPLNNDFESNVPVPPHTTPGGRARLRPPQGLPLCPVPNCLKRRGAAGAHLCCGGQLAVASFGFAAQMRHFFRLVSAIATSLEPLPPIPSAQDVQGVRRRALHVLGTGDGGQRL